MYQIHINNEVLNVTESEDELIEIDHKKDYCVHTVEIENGEVIYKPLVEIPSYLTTTQKADISETVGQFLVALNDNVIALKSPVKAYDLDVGKTSVRVDVKFSTPKKNSPKQKAKHWKFCLSSRGQRKDYTQTCDVLLCIGLRDDGGISAFRIPSSVREVRTLKKHISIPVNWPKSKYGRFHYYDSPRAYTASE